MYVHIVRRNAYSITFTRRIFNQVPIQKYVDKPMYLQTMRHPLR